MTGNLTSPDPTRPQRDRPKCKAARLLAAFHYLRSGHQAVKRSPVQCFHINLHIGRRFFHDHHGV